MVNIPSEEVRVGEILHLVEDDYVPCDAVVLSTSHSSGNCYVMTANLDGETSLKTRYSARATAGKSRTEVSALLAGIECENPNPKVENFLGRMFVFNGSGGGGGGDEDDGTQSRLSNYEPCPLSADNMVHCGTQVKNVNDVYAVCVYAGQETKMALNSQICKNKFGSIEKMLNNYIFFFIFILLFELVLFTILRLVSFSFSWHNARTNYNFS